jgi:YggT family protein
MATVGAWLLIILGYALRYYSYAIFLDAILSFLFPPGSNALVRFLHILCEPVVAPCRSLLNAILPARWRYTMRLDFSPLLAMLLLQLISRLVFMAYSALYLL